MINLDLDSLKRDLKILRTKLAKFNGKWDETRIDDIIAGEDEYYLPSELEKVYLFALALTEKHGLNLLANYIRTRKPQFGPKMLETYYSSMLGEDMLISTFPIFDLIRTLEELYFQKNEEKDDGLKSKWITVRKILRNLPVCATSLDYEFDCEDKLDKFSEAILKSRYSDVNSNPTIDIATSYTMPDTGIPSLKLLIEYKYMGKKADFSNRIRDEMQAAIRNWAGNKSWNAIIFCVYQTSSFFKEKELLRVITGDKTSFDHISVVLITGAGSRNESSTYRKVRGK